jgi:ammonium transporter Rh
VFGAYFGIAVAYMLYDKELTSIEAEQREKSVYHSDLFAMVGTLFLFCFWPSFNAGVAAAGDSRLRAVVNTYISISASVLLTYVCSSLFNKDKKFDMVHIQNATLAGGVAVGTIADKIIRPFGAMIVGSIAGILSTVGFRFIKPVLQKFRAHDTCGVNNLHGMPGLLAGIFGIILAIFPAYSLYTDNIVDTCWHSHERTYLAQIGYQAAALGVTILIAVIGGIITGIILRLPALNDERPTAYFNDHPHWETPDDFFYDAANAIGHSHVEHHAHV